MDDSSKLAPSFLNERHRFHVYSNDTLHNESSVNEYSSGISLRKHIRYSRLDSQRTLGRNPEEQSLIHHIVSSFSFILSLIITQTFQYSQLPALIKDYPSSTPEQKLQILESIRQWSTGSFEHFCCFWMVYLEKSTKVHEALFYHNIAPFLHTVLSQPDQIESWVLLHHLLSVYHFFHN